MNTRNWTVTQSLISILFGTTCLKKTPKYTIFVLTILLICAQKSSLVSNKWFMNKKQCYNFKHLWHFGRPFRQSWLTLNLNHICIGNFDGSKTGIVSLILMCKTPVYTPWNSCKSLTKLVCQNHTGLMYTVLNVKCKSDWIKFEISFLQVVSKVIVPKFSYWANTAKHCQTSFSTSC